MSVAIERDIPEPTTNPDAWRKPPHRTPRSQAFPPVLWRLNRRGGRKTPEESKRRNTWPLTTLVKNLFHLRLWTKGLLDPLQALIVLGFTLRVVITEYRLVGFAAMTPANVANMIQFHEGLRCIHFEMKVRFHLPAERTIVDVVD